MLAEQVRYLRSQVTEGPDSTRWFVPSRIIQGLERELRGERGCCPRGKRVRRFSKAFRPIKEAMVANYDGLDLLIGLTGIYLGRREIPQGLLCMIYVGEGREISAAGSPKDGYVMPALGIAGVTSNRIVCAGYSQGKVPLRTSSWGPKQYPKDEGQVKRNMDGRCAWTLIDKDTHAYRSIPAMVMLLVDAVNQSNL